MRAIVVDVSGWSRLQAGGKHPFWWGMLWLIVIESTIVACFIVSYFYLWIVNAAENRMGWPPAGTSPPPILLPGLYLALLAVGALAMFYGWTAMKRGNDRRFVGAAAASCLAAAGALITMWAQFGEMPFSPGTNAYASFVWVMSGFHFMHVAVVLLATAAIAWLGTKGYFTSQRLIAVQVATMYGCFVSLAWAPMYVVLYWMPRWFR